uniref:Retrotransposon del1-46, related n=1 Tax=Asparagus officinalis TaxID=4686 RepID=Q2AA37_ASPOF|nr:retrotransposon del1-46, related [Asparagus officinalis]
MRAPEFQGSADPLVAHKWKEDVSNILDILSVDSVQKQRLASYSLKGDARRWYRLQFTPEHRTTLAWEDFVYFFDGQYISFVGRTRKELELSRLTQGDMSVAGFKSRFMELLHFTGMWQTGECQAQMFLAGLRPNLR